LSSFEKGITVQYKLNLINLEKDSVALSRFRVLAHRLEVETGRWHKPVAVPFNERKCGPV